MRPRLLMIDNVDSFTFNLVQAFQVLGAEVIVHRNTAISIDAALALAPTHVCISPGPGAPGDAGISIGVVEAFAGKVPILGVCLGHQAIIEAFGGQVVRALRPMHGKTSRIHHDGRTLFEGLPQPFEAARYHSLIGSRQGLPDVLECSAHCEDALMGVRHRRFVVEGVQFHPESIMTPDGMQLLANFMRAPSGQRGMR